MARPRLPPHQLPPLTAQQLAAFVEDGFIVLPAALDPALCRASLAHCWDEIEHFVPRLRRGDPTTWTPITPEETARAEVLRVAEGPAGSLDRPKRCGFGARMISLHDGAEKRVLDLFPRAVFGVAE